MNDWKVEAERRIRASLAHLSNPGRFARERWVAEKFVEKLGVQFTADELTEADEPTDVAFRDARFQVKEHMDEGRKRLDEYRADLARLETATSPADLFTYYEPKDLPLAEVAARVEACVVELLYDPNECRRLDLLFYVNLLGVEIVDDGTPIALTQHPGFRSVSFVADGMAGVLWAEESAPEFLRRNVGTIRGDRASSHA